MELIHSSDLIKPEAKTTTGVVSYHCLADPVPVSAGSMFGVHYDRPSLVGGIYGAHAYENTMQYPCAEAVTTVSITLTYLIVS